MRTPGSLDRGTWLFALLVLLTLAPSAFVLWFMNEAVTTEATAAGQRVLEAYRGQLRLVRSRLDGVWLAQAARLDATEDPEPLFAHLITSQLADGVIVLAGDGTVAYPAQRPASAALVADVERRAASVPQLAPPERDAAIAAIAARLNDYSTPIAAASRMMLMDRLRAVAPNVWLSTQAALHLSMDLLDMERPVPVPGVVRQTALHDVWAVSSADHRVIGLYRTGRIEAMMHDFLHEISPAGIVFIAYPPDVRADAEAVAAGPWLPGWQLSFVPLDKKPFDEIAGRRRTVYLSVAIVGIALMTIAGAAASSGLRRHLRLARLKTDLVAAASHELRTPLASMQVLLDGLLADRELEPEKTREYLTMLSAENARLSRSIESFLTFAKLDSGRYHFSLNPVSPRAVVDKAVDAVRERVPPSSTLTVDADRDLPHVRADADALSIALANLLDNALKYTGDDKRIAVRVRRDGNGFVSFAVADNGIGIPVGERKRIFRRFYRVDQRLSSETGGVGLGLSIVASIVRGHRGRIDVESRPGSGSTLYLHIPVATGKAVA
jgi:signal transduction histidine kinase